MSSGIEIFIANLLSYPVLIGSIVVVIASTILLIAKGKQLNKYKRTFIFALIVIALFITMYLMIMTVKFGNAHPSASPVPIN